MVLDPAAAYRAVVARDARFDGRLFVGVRSTGIYCRPVCRVRTPLERNCRFYANAASAEAHGFRPCLRCRPELAPGLALIDSPHALALHAARLIDSAAHEGRDLSLPEVAVRLGVTDRHLRRIFQLAHGVSPIDYLTTRRLLLAKQLLTDTALPITEVALASGFASVRRFNAAFAGRYRMSPTRLRAEREGAAQSADAAAAPILRLAYRPPYDQRGVLRFIAARALGRVEALDEHGWRRTIALQHQGRMLAGWFTLRFVRARNEVEARVAPALAPALGALARRLRDALDLDAEPALIDRALASLRCAPGLRVPGSIDGFETAVRVVLGQQVSVAAACTLARRLIDRFGVAIETPFAGLNRLFPTPAALADASADAIGRLGIVRQRVAALRALARAVADGRIELHRAAPLDATLDALRALPGIGEWSVQTIALRALAWPDAFASSDIAVLRALQVDSPRAAESAAETWRPWRGYALIALWQTLEKPR